MFESERRDLAWIPRWSITRVNRRQSVAEHSYYVTCYGLEVAKRIEWPHANDATDENLGVQNRMRLCLAMYLLRHDEDEALTGDIPGPTKRLMDADCSKLTPLLRERFGNVLTPTKEMKAIKKVADLIDECFYLAGESNSGNRFVGSAFRNANDRLRKAVSDLPASDVIKQKLFDDLQTRFEKEIITEKNYDGLKGV